MGAKTVFTCQNCGTQFAKWAGKCTECGDWNSLVEETLSIPSGKAARRSPTRLAMAELSCPAKDFPRIRTGISELDRVCGGGLVPGAAILIGGDPGIGKSTILLQALAHMASNGYRCAYFSGEESVNQIRLRARRLGISEAPVQIAATTDALAVANEIISVDGPQIVVVDSIQTLGVANLESAPGTVSQVRAVAAEIGASAKARNAVVLFVGHVTKDNALAGPMALAHQVDAVITFHGDGHHQYRILRAEKNRFGAANEIGVFEMTDAGLVPVANPAGVFISDRQTDIAGSAVTVAIEGTRPLLVEVQALVNPSAFAAPQRAAIGFDRGRLSMILAVLEARCGMAIGTNDIYVNVAGGFKIQEPAADLAVAAAIVSSVSSLPLPADAVFFGEIGLGGEIRPVSQADLRFREAVKLGFPKAYAPCRRKSDVPSGINLMSQNQLVSLVRQFPGVEDSKAA